MAKAYKLDLHTHSIISQDGGIKENEYQTLLEQGILDCIAITDHNQIDFADKLHKKFGKKIIIGEEIMTTDGEMIGLFLRNTIPKGLTAKETAYNIHQQGGIVYIPHPFETLRKGIQLSVLETIKDQIDIVESFNARAKLSNKANQTNEFVNKYNLIQAASSDAHVCQGIGTSFNIVAEIPTAKTIKNLLKEGRQQQNYAPLFTYLSPLINRVRNLGFMRKNLVDRI